jgi:uncharacterized protein (DUF433 family)
VALVAFGTTEHNKAALGPAKLTQGPMPAEQNVAVILLHHLTWRPRMEKLDRITQRPEIMGGKACIRGIRVTVGMIVGQIGAGRSVDELLAEYPYLEREDILQALRYAAWRAEEREVVLANA